MRLLRAAATIGSLTLVSRILGFVRDILMASFLGAGMAADAFVIAFKLPNFFRRLFAEGAFNNAFVPLYTEARTKNGDFAARRFAQEAQAGLALVLLLLAGMAIWFMEYVILAFAPGFAENPEKLAFTIELSRTTFPYVVTICLVALYGSVLNARGQFAAVAATPILLNMCLIGSVLFGAQTTAESSSQISSAQHVAMILSWGVAGAGVIQLLWMIGASARAGTVLWPILPRLTPDVRKLLILMGPAILAVSASQINTLVDMILASLLEEGAVSWLYYADRLTQLPLGVVGIAIGTALLPALSSQLSNAQSIQALNSQNRALEAAWVITIPAAVGLAIASLPIITVLFQRGAFDATASAQAAAALTAYAVGLPAYVGIKVFGPGFFARQDTVTPTKIALIAMVANIGLNLSLMGPLGHVGLALATALAAWVNCLMMVGVLYRRGHFVPDYALLRRLALQLVSAGVMALVVMVLITVFDGWWQAILWQRSLALAIVIGVGVICFFGMALLTKAVRVSHIKSLARRS